MNTVRRTPTGSSGEHRPLTDSEVRSTAASCPVCATPLHHRELPGRDNKLWLQATCPRCGSSGLAHR